MSEGSKARSRARKLDKRPSLVPDPCANLSGAVQAMVVELGDFMLRYQAWAAERGILIPDLPNNDKLRVATERAWKLASE